MNKKRSDDVEEAARNLLAALDLIDKKKPSKSCPLERRELKRALDRKPAPEPCGESDWDCPDANNCPMHDTTDDTPVKPAPEDAPCISCGKPTAMNGRCASCRAGG